MKDFVNEYFDGRADAFCQKFELKSYGEQAWLHEDCETMAAIVTWPDKSVTVVVAATYYELFDELEWVCSPFDAESVRLEFGPLSWNVGPDVEIRGTDATQIGRSG